MVTTYTHTSTTPHLCPFTQPPPPPKKTAEESPAGLYHVKHEAGQSLELRFWKGLPLLPPPLSSAGGGDDAMTMDLDDDGPTAAATEEDRVRNGNDMNGQGQGPPPPPQQQQQRLCVLRVALETPPGQHPQARHPRRLRASCHHHRPGGKGASAAWDTTGNDKDKGGGKGGLALDPARISLPDLLAQAHARLVPARLRWLQARLGQDPALAPLLEAGEDGGGDSTGLRIHLAPGGMSLGVALGGARLAVGVDRRTGHFRLLLAGEGAQRAEDDEGGLAAAALAAEWEAALRADPALAAPRAAEASSMLFRDVLRALLLRRVAALGLARFGLPCDGRWRRLLALGAEEQQEEEEEDEDALKVSRAAAASVYLTLASTAALPPPGTAALGGGMWQLLEVEVPELSQPPQAYLVTAASAASATAIALPTLRARRRLAVPPVAAVVAGGKKESDADDHDEEEEGLAAWLGTAVAAARAALPWAAVLDGVASALLPPSSSSSSSGTVVVPDGAVEALRGGGAVTLLSGAGEGDGIVDALIVQCDGPAGATWRWWVRMPALAALGAVGNGGGEHVVVDGGKRMVMRWGGGVAAEGGGGEADTGWVEVVFSQSPAAGAGGWHPLVHARRLLRALAAVAQLSRAAASAALAAGSGGGGGVLHGFEVVDGAAAPLPELRFRDATAAAEPVVLALRHPALDSDADSSLSSLDGPLYLALLAEGNGYGNGHGQGGQGAPPGSGTGSTRLLPGAQPWRLAEAEFARTGDVPTLLRRVGPLARPLAAVGRAVAAVGGGRAVDVVPWAAGTVAVTCPEVGGERVLVVAVLMGEGGGAEGVVRATRHDQGEGEARTQREWGVVEFGVEAARGEVAWLVGGGD